MSFYSNQLLIMMVTDKVILGLGDFGSFNVEYVDGHVDELRYHYRVLNPTGKIRPPFMDII